MQPDPASLLTVLALSTPPIGFYDTPVTQPFEPFAAVQRCVFSGYRGWMRGASTCLSEDNLETIGCPGAGYWNCDVATVPREQVAHYLGIEEGLKASLDLMCQWLTTHPPYRREHAYIVIGPLRRDYYQYLKSVTFFVPPDQLSLLITGAEYCNASNARHPVTAVYGTGCGQLAAVFADLDAPAATIGGTDIAMRSYLPQDTLAFTVTKPMFEQLCRLDERSFLHKSFWAGVKRSRQQQRSAATQGRTP